jgi:hypothetical protein
MAFNQRHSRETEAQGIQSAKHLEQDDERHSAVVL